MVSPVCTVRGFTVKELLVTIAVIVVLVVMAFPFVLRLFAWRSSVSVMSNTRGIHMAAMAMAIDGATSKDLSLGWPGDLKTRGKISTLSDFVNVLVRNNYLHPNDLKVFSARGFIPYQGALSSDSVSVLVPAFKEENNAFKVFLIKDESPANTVFLTSKNYTYNSPLNHPKARPFGDKGFVVLRKGGDASILKQQQTQSLALVGVLPGGAKVESAENCLNPDPKAP